MGIHYEGKIQFAINERKIEGDGRVFWRKK